MGGHWWFDATRNTADETWIIVQTVNDFKLLIGYDISYTHEINSNLGIQFLICLCWMKLCLRKLIFITETYICKEKLVKMPIRIHKCPIMCYCINQTQAVPEYLILYRLCIVNMFTGTQVTKHNLFYNIVLQLAM